MTESVAGGPYLGLQPFTEEYAPYFFGRARDTRVLTANLYAGPITVLYGESGVGKTSLLMAAVVPELRRHARDVVVPFGRWQGSSPLLSLKSACIAAVTAQLGSRAPELDSAEPLDVIVDRCARATGGGLIVILDQFDEYFVYNPDPSRAEEFEEQFARTVNRTDVDASFLISIREDSLSKLDRFQGRIPNLLENTVRLEALSVDAAEEAIRKPLERNNAERRAHGKRPIGLEDRLVTELIADADQRHGAWQSKSEGRAADGGAGRVDASVLQLLMARLFKEAITTGSLTMDLESYVRLGRAERIAGAHVDDVMAGLELENRAIAARAFHYLVTPSGSKIAYSAADLAEQLGADSSAVAKTLQLLSSGGKFLLRAVDTTAGEHGTCKYELFHDTLATQVIAWATQFKREERAQQERAEQEAKERATREKLEAEVRFRKRLGRFYALLGVVLFVAFVVCAVFLVLAQQAKAAAERAQGAAETARLEQTWQVVMNYARSELRTNPISSLKAALRATECLPASPAGGADDAGHRSEAIDVLSRALDACLLAKQENLGLGHVTSLSYATDGSYALVADNGNQGFVIVRDKDGVERARLGLNQACSNDKDQVSSERIQFAPGRTDRLAILCQPRTGYFSVNLLALSGRGLRPLLAKPVPAIAFELGKESLVTVSLYAGDKSQLELRAVEDGSRRTPFPLVNETITALKLSSDSSTLFTVSQNGQLRLWKPDGKTVVLRDQENADLLGLDPSGRFLATVEGGRVRIWDSKLDPGEPFQAMLPRFAAPYRELVIDTQVSELEFSAEGELVALAGSDGKVRVFGVQSGDQLLTLVGHVGPVAAMAFDPQTRMILTGGWDGMLRWWQPGPLDDARTSNVAVLPDGKVVATSDMNVYVWDLDHKKLVAKSPPEGDLHGHRREEINDLAVAPNARRAATAGQDGRVCLWNLDRVEAGPELPCLQHATDVLSVAFDGDDTLYSVDRAQTLYEWDLGARASPRRTHTVAGAVTLATSTQGHTLVAGGRAPFLTLVEPASGEPKGAPLSSDFIVDATFDTEGKYLAAGGTEAKLILWQRETNKIATQSAHCQTLASVAFDATSKHVATAAWDGTVMVWSVPELKPELRLTQDSPVYSVQFDRQGNLVTGSADGRIRRTYLDLSVLKKEAHEKLGALHEREVVPNDDLEALMGRACSRDGSRPLAALRE
jgi:WD40 repeat protein